MKKILAVLLVVSFISFPFAGAHPFTEQTIPDSSSNVPVGTTKIIVYFSEPVDIDFSEIKVLDANGDQIDNRDTAHYEDELSIIVTTPPLQDGIYTATTKVLSKIDGHLVPSAFLFGVGDVVVNVDDIPAESGELIYLPEAGSRFPGIVGQTIVLGAVITSMAVWGTLNKNPIRDEIEKIQKAHHARFMSITGIGLVLVFISDILMIAVQTIRLEASPADVIATYFGTVWLARMVTTVILLGIWFGLDRQKTLSQRNQAPMLAASLVLISTTSLIGHGAATEEVGAFVLDYIHNLVAAVWIGGIIYFAFVLLGAFSKLDGQQDRMSLLVIPRFSMAFTVSIGIVIITGPMLMWFLESDVGLITGSVFGQLIILKIAIASVMVGLGGFLQLRIQRDAEKNISDTPVHNKLKKTLKADMVLGVILLGIVALLTNGTLPAGEIQRVDAQEISYGFNTVEFTDGARFDVNIFPFSSGTNTISIKVTDLDGDMLHDSGQIKVKVSNPSKNIAPIEVLGQASQDTAEFQGEITFGFSGNWLVEIEAQRTEEANESKMLNLLVKPRLSDIQMQVTEYELPEDAKPLYPLYDGTGSLWISDASAPRLWEFALDTREFTPHTFDGLSTTFLTQYKEKIWFVDSPRNQIGFLDTLTKEFTTTTIPKLDPVTSENTPLSIQADSDGNIWITIINKDKIVRYAPQEGTFDEVSLPQKESLPFALAVDSQGRIWYTATGTGKVGYIDGDRPVEIMPGRVLDGPEALLFDDDGNLWITEHTGLAITRFDPVLDTAKRIPVPNVESLPFGMAQDRYANVWFAQHVVDSIGVYDPHNDQLLEVSISTESSFIQFMASDGDNVWFVEQQGNKIGTIQMTEIPASAQVQQPGFKYAEVASPLIALGIIATSLFYVKAVHDKRRLDGLINSGTF